MSKIAVVGCGIFGATIALKLMDHNHDVTVFERLPRPLSGASFNNQNRLHLGFHYPRDAETARHCIRGFEAFKAAFPGCIVEGFPNAYFIAAEGSQTTPKQYLSFCDDLSLRYRLFDPPLFEPSVTGVALGLLTDEVVYDSERLGKCLCKRLEDAGTDVRYKTEVSYAEKNGNRLVLGLAGGWREAFDAVVNATYANISRLAGSLGLPLVERQYEYTVVPIIDTPFPRTGITIMDGCFMTVLPFGAGAHHLLYHVEHTVIATSIGHHVNPSWLDQSASPFARLDAQALFERMRAAAIKFVPALADARLVGFLHGPRVVLTRSAATDARPSIIEQPLANYISVFSGKIGHSIWIAEAVAEKLRD